MDNFLRDKNRDTVLFVNEIPANQVDWAIKGIKETEKKLGRKLKVLILADKRDKIAMARKVPEPFKRIAVNTDSIMQLEAALLPYHDKLVAVTCRGDRNIPYFKKIIPHVPYLRTPSEESLEWTINKIDMRRRLRTFDKKISPAYTIVTENTEESKSKIIKNIGFPCVVKPASLGASVLVTICYHEDELDKSLTTIFKRLKTVHKNRGYTSKPQVLVEEFMDGEMYSTDIYVNSRGTTFPTPLVKIITGFSAGLGDFFGYKQMTPTLLTSKSESDAIEVAEMSVKAMGMRSATAHVELMKTARGWKVIELGPRVGGFRDFLYEMSFGINHAANDIITRLPMKPAISKRVKGHSAVMKLYPESQGVIEKINGLVKIRDLESLMRIEIKAGSGDSALFARNGGGSIVDIYLYSIERSQLLADIRRVEQLVKIHVTSKKKWLEAAIAEAIEEVASEDDVIETQDSTRKK